MSPQIADWAWRFGVSPQALAELSDILGAHSYPNPQHEDATTEAGVQSRERRDASVAGGYLWRNNSGAFQDEHGNHIRYGLCNDSPKINKVLKSSDLIGIRPVEITQAMVGHTIGQFIARECKAPGWRWRNKPSERELAQHNFLTLIQSLGGDAKFVS